MKLDSTFKNKFTTEDLEINNIINTTPEILPNIVK